LGKWCGAIRRLGVGQFGADGCALAGEEGRRGLQHARGQVAGHDLAGVGRAGQSGVPAAGGDVQHALGAAEPGQLNQPPQVRPGGVDGA